MFTPTSPYTLSAAALVYALPKEEILLECAEALEHVIVDGSHRELHLGLIDELIAAGKVSGYQEGLLKAVAARMKSLCRLTVFDLASINRDHDVALAAELRSSATASQRYLYHGTICGRLQSIAQSNLRPAEIPVWTNSASLRTHCEQAVFFTTNWRSAVNWAEVAHLKSRGRKDSFNRRKVIIRVGADSLASEPDLRATAPHCILVRDEVAVMNAQVFVSPLLGFPHWIPLHDYVRSSLKSK